MDYTRLFRCSNEKGDNISSFFFTNILQIFQDILLSRKNVRIFVKMILRMMT